MTVGRMWAIILFVPVFALFFVIESAGYWDLPHWRFPNSDHIAAFDPEIGYLTKPHLSVNWAVGEAFNIYTDRYGARVSHPGDETPAQADLLFIGCSMTWGDGVEYHQTFAARLADKFNVPTANLSLFAYGTTQSLQMLRRHRDLKPKLVIYSVIGDHLWRNVSSCAHSFYPFCLDVSYVDKSDGKAKIVPPKSDGVNRLQLQVKGETRWLDPLTWIIHRLDVIYGRITWAWSRSVAADEMRQAEAFDFLMSEMSHTVHELGAKLLVVYLPMRRDDSPPEGLARSLSRLQITLLDLSPVFREFGGTTEEFARLYVPSHHPSEIGHALIAEKVGAFVQSHGLLPRP